MHATFNTANVGHDYRDQISLSITSVTGLNVRENRGNPKVRAVFCPRMKLASARRDPDVICGIKARPSHLWCVSVAASAEQRPYLGEDETDQAGWRQSACLSACRGLDRAHIKGRGEEAGGASEEGGLLVGSRGLRRHE